MLPATMAVDFSYLSDLNAIAYENAISRGERVTDQMFTDALISIQPPPLDPASMTQLLTELDESKPRKNGRPNGNMAIRMQLALKLVGVPETVMPILLRDCLIARLQSRSRYTEIERYLPYLRRSDRQRRDMFIRGLHRDLKDMVRKRKPVVHEILGRIDESPALHFTAARDKTLAIVAELMRNRFDEKPPALSTMSNLLSKKTKSKNVKDFGSTMS